MGLFDRIRGRRDEEAAMLARKHVDRGRDCQQGGELGEALQEYRKAVKLDPNCADAYYGLGRCCHGLAREENQRAGGTIYFRAGLGHLAQAAAAFEQAAGLQPQAADVCFNLALVYDNAARLEDAERCYRKAIQLDPDGMDGADAHFNLSLLLYMRAIGWAGLKQFPGHFSVSMGDPALEMAFAEAEKGIALGERIVQHDRAFLPNLIQAHRRLGEWYSKHLQGSRAIPHFQAILRLDPRDSQAREWLTLAEKNTGQKLL